MTATITTWPAHTAEPIPVPLPHLGRCPDCPEEVRIRGNGRLYAHRCTGDGSLPLLVLRPTFARWLWAQSRRRDDYTNLLTLFAGRIYRGCTRAPKRHAGDMPWSSAEELHDQLHHEQYRLTGSEVRQTYDGQRCDAMCRHLETARRHYEQLLVVAGIDDAGQDEEPGPIVRVFRRDAGWVLPDYTDLADCTSNFHREQDGRPACTEIAVWKVVEEHTSADGFPMLTLSFWCDTDLPAEHQPREEAA